MQTHTHTTHTQHVPFMVVAYGREEMFDLTMHSTHFIYGYVASDIW